MLHLYTGFEVILTHGHDRSLSDAVPAAECGQCRIGQRCAAGSKFFMDSHQVSLAGDAKIEDLLPIGFGFLRPLDYRDLRRVRA